MRFIIGTVLAGLIAAVILLGGFRIRTVEILGSERYTAEEIKEDLIYDLWTKNTLYFSWKYRHAGSDACAPYLDSIQAKMLSPGKVRLQVKEKKLLGYVQYAGNNVYFDSDGEVLEITENIYEKIPLVAGIAMDEPVLYQKLPVENSAQLRTILNITGLLLNADLIPDDISFGENLTITLHIGNIEVKLGQDEYLEEKVSNLVTIYQEIKDESGVLNMESFTGKNEPISLRPMEEETGTEETDPEETQLQVQQETDGEGNAVDNSEETDAVSDDNTDQETTGVSSFMVFDSSGTLRYDAHVVNGLVVDAYGNPIDGCSVEENGYVKDAYWNIIDPQTGELAQ